jgi:phosphoribosylformylglycinamidine cyclo-ligase
MTRSAKTYAQSGVNYQQIDPIKVLAQQQAQQTASNLTTQGMHEISASRGESAYVWEEADAYRALVVEGLGTKNLVADAMRSKSKTYYDQIAQDTVAMIVNDLIVVGALPQVINAYFAVGDSAWLTDTKRASDLIKGWAAACDLAGATWGGGETPTLKGIINPETIDLAGSAIGRISPKENLILGDALTAGDVLILIESSGIHANGLTMARSIADQLPEGYNTKLTDGRTYGEALLTPTPIYVPLVRELQEQKLEIHYMINITGHGWRKLMRATKAFTYVVDKIPTPQPEFLVIQKGADATDQEMYGNFNMGAGFAIYAPANQATAIIACATKVGLKAWQAGKVQKGPKQVIITPKHITFTEETLEVR